jgi:hypothetical protein
MTYECVKSLREQQTLVHSDILQRAGVYIRKTEGDMSDYQKNS